MVRLLCILLMLAGTPAWAADAADFRADALAIEQLVNDKYAYPERLPNGRIPLSARLRSEAQQVQDKRSLLRYAERALFTLADHHAITGASFPDSYAVVPSYADLWVVLRGRDYVVEAVREGSPSARAGVRAGDVLTAIGGATTSRAVAAFWADLGLEVTAERAAFAARVLAAGRRDKPRDLSFRRGQGAARRIKIPNLYRVQADRPPVSAHRSGLELVIRINDALGNRETIAAFDRAMAGARPGQRVIIDLTDTPGGGNTVVARAMMGWFVDRPTPYQIHNLPAEQRETGIARQWVEQVLPRAGKYHAGPVTVRVGRWTGSMGEGLAIGFRALGAEVIGTRMAGLLGAIYDYPLPASGLVLKLPTERMMAVDGTPREDFVPAPERR